VSSRDVERDKRTVIAGLAAGGALLLLGLGIGADRYAPGSAINPITYVKAVARLIAGGGPPETVACGSIGSGESCWGAIVEKNGGVFARVKEPTKAEAENGAMNLCAQRLGAGGCRVTAILSRKECWALFEVPSNPSDWRGASGASVEQAMANAKTSCEGDYGYCRMGMTFCADGSNRTGGTE
jgi:hypothetical protein